DKYNSNFLITRGSEGIALFERNGDTSYFSSKKKLVVHDVTGAGDSVAAVSALCLASGLDFKETANIANITGRIVVQKPGTSTLTVAELKEVLMISQINMSRKKVDKVWGSEDWIVNYEQSNYCGKRLILNKGYQCSIHYHKIKSEVFYINKGLVLMQAYGKEKLMTPGDSLLIEPGTKHRFIGLSDAEIIEFSSHHKEEDSYRDEPSGKIDDVTFNSYMERYAEEMKK
ncbi:cupin domain-containing protein, partial [Candidatus Woesearchaeota archaeon]|nr:cupin domain-containing protein [Candidatus Woesearchaeota archaeon]